MTYHNTITRILSLRHIAHRLVKPTKDILWDNKREKGSKTQITLVQEMGLIAL